jgi:hypothetical protein
MAGATAPRVIVVTKDGCHLCEDAVAIVAQVCESLGVAWSPRDLTDVGQSQQDQWSELIPVVLVDDAVHEVLRVDAVRLRDALS